MSGRVGGPKNTITALPVEPVSKSEESVGEGGYPPGYVPSDGEGEDQVPEAQPGVVVEITGEGRPDSHALTKARGVTAYKLVQELTDPSAAKEEGGEE